MFRASFKKEKENVFDCKNSHDKPCCLYKKNTKGQDKHLYLWTTNAKESSNSTEINARVPSNKKRKGHVLLRTNSKTNQPKAMRVAFMKNILSTN